MRSLPLKLARSTLEIRKLLEANGYIPTRPLKHQRFSKVRIRRFVFH